MKLEPTVRWTRPALVVALVAVLPACSSKPDGRTAPAAPADSHEQERAEPAPPMVFEGPGEKLPRALGELSIATPPRYFGPDDLYDLINGGAEVYVEFGLVRMVTADYTSPRRPGITVTAEIYDMGSVEGAFGRAARFLEGRQDPSAAGEGLPSAWADRGLLGAGDLVTWRDRFVVHLTLLDESATADGDSIAAAGRELLPPMAEAVFARISPDPPPPSDLALFPAAHRIARSEAWSPSNLAGIEGLGRGCTVRYADAGLRWTAFATVALTDEAAAESVWKTVLGSEAPGRRIAARVAGKRLVGAVAEGDGTPDMERLEAFTRTLVAAFQPQ